jgi:hypothetical protein
LKRPLAETVPPVADQVMAGLVIPGIVAVNCCVSPLIIVVVVGEIERVETVTEALAVKEEAAALVAVTVCVPV